MNNWKKTLKRYNEWVAIPLAAGIYVFFPKLYRLWDPTAGSFDAGMLHIFAFVAIAILLASATAWILFRLNFPQLYRYVDRRAEDDFLQNGRRDGILYSLVIYFVYFVFFMVAVCVMV